MSFEIWLVKDRFLMALVTLRDVSVWRARECSSAQGDETSLGLGFTWPLGANKIDTSIP